MLHSPRSPTPTALPHAQRFLISTAAIILLTIVSVRVWTERPDVCSPDAADLMGYYLPNTQYSVDELRNGRLPLWNPYEFAGMPMFATLEYAPLYPTTWLAFILPPDTAHLTSTLFHLFLLGLFTYLLLRYSVHIEPTAAFFGALAVCLSGWALCRMLTTPDEFRSAAYIPLVLLLAHRLAAKPNIYSATAFALALALQFLAGESEVFVRTLQLAAAYLAIRALFTARDAGPTGLMRLFVMCLVSGLIVIGLTALQLFPAQEASQFSPRSIQGLTFRQAFQGGVENPISLLLMMLSGVQEHAATFYVGAFAFLFAGYAFRRPHAATWFFLTTALVTYDLLRGEASCTAHVYYHLPGGSLFRCPIRFLPFFVVSLGILAAMGLNHLIEDLRNERKRVRCLPAAYLALSCFLILLWDRAAPSTESSVISLASIFLLALASAAAFLPPNRWTSPLFVMGAVISLAVVPCLLFDVRQYGIPPHPDLVGLPQTVQDFLEHNRQPGERIYVDFATRDPRRVPKVGPLTKTECINGFSPFMPRSFWESIRPYRSDRIEPKNLSPADTGYVPFGMSGGLALSSGALDAFRALGVRFIVIGLGTELFYPHQKLAPPPALPPGISRAFQDGDYTVLRVEDPLPRAFVLPDDTTPSSFRELIDLVDTQKVASIPLIETKPHRIVLQTDPGSTGMLVLTDQFYPGWYAFEDGQRRDIQPVARLFRGMHIDAKGHQIEFRYRPPRIILGAIISSLTLALCIVIFYQKHSPNHPHTQTTPYGPSQPVQRNHSPVAQDPCDHGQLPDFLSS